MFVEATESIEEVRALTKLLERPQLINIVIGGKTPVLDQVELAELGFGVVLYANASLQGAALGIQKSLGQLKKNGRLDEDPTFVVTFLERQRMVNKPYFDALENKYIYKI